MLSLNSLRSEAWRDAVEKFIVFVPISWVYNNGNNKLVTMALLEKIIQLNCFKFINE